MQRVTIKRPIFYVKIQLKRPKIASKIHLRPQKKSIFFEENPFSSQTIT